MIKDELELITGKLFDGNTTPVVYEMLKAGKCFEQVSQDILSRRKGRPADADVHVKLETPAGAFGEGFDVLQWLSDVGQTVTVQGDGGRTL